MPRQTIKRTKISNLSQIISSSSLSRPETEILLAFILKKTREFILTHPETKLTASAYRRFRILEKKRLAAWPIAYLTGHKEFYGLDFKVSPATLVPRPETEMIVKKIVASAKSLILKKLPDMDSASWPLIIDLGTGSGAIIIAVASELKRLFPTDYKNIEFSAVDISPGALKVAKQNAAAHKLNKKIRFYRGNLLRPLTELTAGRPIFKVDSRLIISANLPYLTPGQIKKSPSIKREPKLALDGGADGLKYYRTLFRQLSKTPFRSATVLCEIDPGQAKKITALAAEYFPAAVNSLQTDLSGQNRLFVLELMR